MAIQTKEPATDLATEKPLALAGGTARGQLAHLRAHLKFQHQEEFKQARVDWCTTITREQSRRHIARAIHDKINFKAEMLQRKSLPPGYNPRIPDSRQQEQEKQLVRLAQGLRRREAGFPSPGDCYRIPAKSGRQDDTGLPLPHEPAGGRTVHQPVRPHRRPGAGGKVPPGGPGRAPGVPAAAPHAGGAGPEPEAGQTQCAQEEYMSAGRAPAWSPRGPAAGRPLLAGGRAVPGVRVHRPAGPGPAGGRHPERTLGPAGEHKMRRLPGPGTENGTENLHTASRGRQGK